MESTIKEGLPPNVQLYYNCSNNPSDILKFNLKDNISNKYLYYCNKLLYYWFFISDEEELSFKCIEVETERKHLMNFRYDLLDFFFEGLVNKENKDIKEKVTQFINEHDCYYEILQFDYECYALKSLSNETDYFLHIPEFLENKYLFAERYYEMNDINKEVYQYLLLPLSSIDTNNLRKDMNKIIELLKDNAIKNIEEFLAELDLKEIMEDQLISKILFYYMVIKNKDEIERNNIVKENEKLKKEVERLHKELKECNDKIEKYEKNINS